MQKFLIRLLIDNSSRIFKSISTAYREVIRNNPSSGSANYNKNSSNQRADPFANFSFFDSTSTQMTKSEALKILNFSENEKLNARKIIERFEKYFELNNPQKGGSFYLQNKFFYAKELLIKDFSNEDTSSKFDNLTNEDYIKNHKKDNKV